MTSIASKLDSVKGFKDFVYTLRAALGEKGFQVPHGVVLEATAQAVGHRSWNHLSASLAVETAAASIAELQSPVVLESLDILLVRLARTIGVIEKVSRTKKGVAQAAAALSKSVISLTGLSDSNEAVNVSWYPFTGTLSSKATEPVKRVFWRNTRAIADGVAFNIPTGASVPLFDSQSRLLMESFQKYWMPEIEAFSLNFPGPFVAGEIHSDDRRAQATFDARPFLAQASDELLKAVWAAGLTGDYCTDDIADSVYSVLPSSDLKAVFDYLNAVQMVGKDAGYECSMDEEDFLNWVKAVKPHLHEEFSSKN